MILHRDFITTFTNPIMLSDIGKVQIWRNTLCKFNATVTKSTLPVLFTVSKHTTFDSIGTSQHTQFGSSDTTATVIMSMGGDNNLFTFSYVLTKVFNLISINIRPATSTVAGKLKIIGFPPLVPKLFNGFTNLNGKFNWRI